VGAQQEDEGPADQHPADRAAHAHRAEIGRRVAQVGEGDRVGHRQGRHIDQAEDQVAGEERPEAVAKRRPDQGQAADQVADRQEPLGREVAVGELVGEEDADQGGHAPRAADQRLLPGREAQHAHVGEDLRRPGAPDRQLKHHHQEEPQARLHGSWPPRPAWRLISTRLGRSALM
jgi:hypothetical protein